MFRSEHHKRRTIKRIRTGRIYRDGFRSAVYLKINLCAIGFTDPVGLHFLNLFGPIELIQIVQESVRILGDPKHPLTEIFLGNFRAATFTLAVDNLFIGKPGLTGRTPINRHLLFISKAVLKHLYKDPLRPFIKIRIRGVDLTVPIINRCDLIDLSFDIIDIVLCGNRRMNAHLDGIILCGKSECIPSHGMDQIVTV